MSDIAPISRSLITGITSSGRPSSVAATTSLPERGDDSVELSRGAQLLSKLNQLPDVRQDLVTRVRGEIAKGGYDSDDKIDALIDNLSEDLAN